ncbi:phage baseplate upper protein [Staphylococcus coagulans]|uniref:BppU family phage baseplate upper protein n=1 Tax=Staphylococcus coagulans TaxID=74706 RepID=A0A9X0PGH3_9STAP|nr:phage baseplate upper protein [Staphylococcus coagulans]ELJ9288542.1 BppU family phage baseplate upper protein [Staphylococcus pseudintermedius]MBA8772133.1 BppU family phage baseplate upper protein [Staphylococcus coagulans]MBA8777387.1 BppU family phage baseplate upper protein [Staphylococcus coagulans]
MANQDLFYDITKQGTNQEKQQYLVTRVGDGGLKTVTVTVWSNGTPYNLHGLTPVFEGVKPDGEKIIDTRGAIVLDPVNGVFRYTFPHQASTAEGEYRQAFFKLKRGEQTDSVLEIKITVLKNMVEFGINSESYFTEYQQKIAELEVKINSYLEELKTKAAGTEAQVEANATLAKALKQQLDLIQSIANERELLTKGEFNEAVNKINNNVDAINTKIESLKRETNEEIERIKGEVTGVKSGVLDDVSNITKSGVYYFDNTTKNVPTRNSNNANGYIEAVMKNENNGMLTMLGAGYAIEKYNGKLHGRWVTSVPVKLWSGKLTKGQTATLKGNCHEFGNLLVEVSYTTNRHATEFINIPGNGSTIYMNNIGMRSADGGFKNGHLDEVVIQIKDDTHIVLEKTLKATGDEKAVDSDAYITAIYGIY